MTVFTTDHADSGEIPRIWDGDLSAKLDMAGTRIDDLGTEPTRDLRDRLDTGEKTQRIDPRLIQAPSFDAIPRRIIEIDDTVTFHSPMKVATGCVDLEGPQKPPPPLPPPPKNIADWERLVDTEQLGILGMFAGVDGDLRHAGQPAPLPPLHTAGAQPKPKYRGKHRLTLAGRWLRLPSEVRGFAKFAVLVVAAGAVGRWLA